MSTRRCPKSTSCSAPTYYQCHEPNKILYYDNGRGITVTSYTDLSQTNTGCMKGYINNTDRKIIFVDGIISRENELIRRPFHISTTNGYVTANGSPRTPLFLTTSGKIIDSSCNEIIPTSDHIVCNTCYVSLRSSLSIPKD